jgi:hypothetical protein
MTPSIVSLASDMANWHIVAQRAGIGYQRWSNPWYQQQNRGEKFRIRVLYHFSKSLKLTVQMLHAKRHTRWIRDSPLPHPGTKK